MRTLIKRISQIEENIHSFQKMRALHLSDIEIAAKISFILYHPDKVSNEVFTRIIIILRKGIERSNKPFTDLVNFIKTSTERKRNAEANKNAN